MTGLVDWAAERARMVIAFVLLSIGAGVISYVGLPKEGEPDIDIPVLFVSVPFPGISAEDSEKLIVKPLEQELRDLDGLKAMTATAAEGYAGVALEFEFGWNKTETMADVRDKVNQAEADWPDGVEQYSINEINFSQFPIVVVSLAGELPERQLLRIAKDLQTEIESLGAILEAPLSGHREEMVEVLIDPQQLEAYNVTANELVGAVVNNNQLIAAGEVESATGAFSLKIPASFDSPADIYDLPVKVNGDRVITLGDLAEIRLTFEDRAGTARFNGEPTVAIQAVKRKGENLIDTVALIKETVDAVVSEWPQELKDAIRIDFSMDQSVQVDGMVSQLEASVLTAIALVMIVVLAALGPRSALLVGFAIPTSFLLCFAILAVIGITISNIVMFALILAVGMLVDGAIVVVEYADKEISRGQGPMRAYVAAAKRMFWPIVSSTATTLCAFLPMLFWPGVPGEFMGNLPRTLIFVLSASLVVALVYLPVLGGVAGRMSRFIEYKSEVLRQTLHWSIRAVLFLVAAGVLLLSMMMILRGGLPGFALFFLAIVALAGLGGSFRDHGLEPVKKAGYRRTIFGRVISGIVGNWTIPGLPSWMQVLRLMPVLALALTIAFVVSVFSYFGQNSKGVEFFVETEPELVIVQVRARGNLSLEGKDALVRQVEEVVLTFDEVKSAFAFAGSGGISQFDGGADTPKDLIGQVQVEFTDWDSGRRKGDLIIAEMREKLEVIPGIQVQIAEQATGPASGKPINVRVSGDNWEDLLASADTVRSYLLGDPELRDVDDTKPLPGIDWEIDVDVEQAGRYGANVSTVGATVQLVTRGILLDTMQVDSSDEEIEIRVRYPEEKRIVSTLDEMRVRTSDGLVPLANFITRKPVPKLAEITRYNGTRYLLIRADVEEGANANAKIERITAWLGLHDVLPNDMDPAAIPALLEEMRADPTGVRWEKLAAFIDQSFADAAKAEADATAGADGDAEASAPPADDAPKPSEVFLEGGNAAEVEAAIAAFLAAGDQMPTSVSYEFAGDQEEQAESMAFLGQAFIGALGLMFVILLAQFNSVYNSVVVLTAVVLSVTGVLIGMLVMDQAFSIIMTGTGIVALAGIVVNNNIVLIDTYQEYAKYLPRTEAIVRTAEDRIRPVLLTTVTTMAGLTPMMFGVSVDFFAGGYTVDAPTALWWKQLATAVVFGLGLATVLTLVVTPALLAVRVRAEQLLAGLWTLLLRILRGANTPAWLDSRLRRGLSKETAQDLNWGLPSARPVLRPAASEAAVSPHHAAE